MILHHHNAPNNLHLLSIFIHSQLHHLVSTPSSFQLSICRLCKTNGSKLQRIYQITPHHTKPITAPYIIPPIDEHLMFISGTRLFGRNTPDRVHVVVTHVSTLSCEVLGGHSVWKLVSNCECLKRVRTEMLISIGSYHANDIRVCAVLCYFNSNNFHQFGKTRE
jgi:hypothetical protein